MDQTNHTFAICAYRESPYLDECIISLKEQNLPSRIVLCTSTPNPHIERCALLHDLPLFVRTGETDITADWNFAYEQASDDYVTIAHQDDIYCPEYAKTALQYLENAKIPLIFFTDYAELRDGTLITENDLLRVKRRMLSPLKVRAFQRSRFIRRRILSLGDPICCPSVTFAKKNLPSSIFQSGFQSCEDWEAWEKLSRLKGDFLYSPETLTYHRIHGDSATTAIIGENLRNAEDYVMFRKFWPKCIAKALTKAYAKSEKSNQLQ